MCLDLKLWTICFEVLPKLCQDWEESLYTATRWNSWIPSVWLYFPHRGHVVDHLFYWTSSENPFTQRDIFGFVPTILIYLFLISFLFYLTLTTKTPPTLAEYPLRFENIFSDGSTKPIILKLLLKVFKKTVERSHFLHFMTKLLDRYNMSLPLSCDYNSKTYSWTLLFFFGSLSVSNSWISVIKPSPYLVLIVFIHDRMHHSLLLRRAESLCLSCISVHVSLKDH